MALSRCSRGIRFGTIACRHGMSNDTSMPVATDVATMCHGSIRSVAISTAVSNAMPANIARLTVTSLKRLTRSATTPPHMDSSRIGPLLATVTRPSITGDSVSSCISHRRPANSAQMPMFENAAPTQNRKYSR